MNGEKHLNMLAEVMPPEVLAKVRAEIENGRARDVLGATARVLASLIQEQHPFPESSKALQDFALYCQDCTLDLWSVALAYGRHRDGRGVDAERVKSFWEDWAHEYIDTYEYTEGAFDPEDPGNQADIPDGLKQKFILDNSEQ